MKLLIKTFKEAYQKSETDYEDLFIAGIHERNYNHLYFCWFCKKYKKLLFVRGFYNDRKLFIPISLFCSEECTNLFILREIAL